MASKETHVEFMHRVLTSAAELATAYFGNVTATKKSDDPNQVLTEADLKITLFLIDEIRKCYPDYNIIDEETGTIDRGSEWTWVIDPIDGTSNFAMGLPHFGIQIGLLHHAQPVAGGVQLPAFGELFLAEKGKGCTLNGQPIQTTTAAELIDVLVAYGIDSHRENPELTHRECAKLANLILAVRNLRCSNSAFDAVQTACGKYGAWINRSCKIWDVVPLHIILTEAGCVYTDVTGQSPDYTDPLTLIEANFTACAAPPSLHKQLLALVN